MSENTIGEYADKKAFVGQHDSPVVTGSNGGANITQPSLNDAEQEYIVGQVGYHGGVTPIITTMTADTTNSGTDLNITASEQNLSAKYKNPNVKQDTSQMPPNASGQERSI